MFKKVWNFICNFFKNFIFSASVNQEYIGSGPLVIKSRSDAHQLLPAFWYQIFVMPKHIRTHLIIFICFYMYSVNRKMHLSDCITGHYLFLSHIGCITITYMYGQIWSKPDLKFDLRIMIFRQWSGPSHFLEDPDNP